MKSIWKYLFAFACVFSAVSLVGGVVGTDGTVLDSTADLGDIDMEATTIGDLGNLIAPGYSSAPMSFGIGYGTCSTAYSDTIKKVEAPGVTYKDGGIVTIWFQNAVQSGAFIELNNTGAYGGITSFGDSYVGDSIKAGDVATFVCGGGWYFLISIYSKDKTNVYYATCDTASDVSTKDVKTLRYAADTNDNDLKMVNDNPTAISGKIIIVKFTNSSAFLDDLNLCINGARALVAITNPNSNSKPIDNLWEAGETVAFVIDSAGYANIIDHKYPYGQPGTKGIVETSTSTNSTETVGVAAAPAAVKAVREYVDKAVETRVSSDNVTNLVWDIYLTSHRYFYDAVTETTYRQVIEDDFYKLIAVTNVPPSYEVIKALESSDSE